MKVYQVTKYDPKYYGSQGYQRDEWLGYREIGWAGNAPVLTFDAYFKVETGYASSVVEFVKQL
ncbi:MAG: hypothetical protein AAF607_01225 [Pseudomonadota bacterium]